MNRFFSFLTKGESHFIIRVAAKVFRVIYTLLAILSAAYVLVIGAIVNYENIGQLLAVFILAIITFFIIIVLGVFIESMLVGFSNIVENQYEELVLKDKGEDPKEQIFLNRKQNANLEKLNRLNELKKTGAITDEEFEKKKEKYLSNL